MRYLLSLSVGFVSGIVLSSFVLTDVTLFFCIILSVVLGVYSLARAQVSVRVVGFIISLFFLGVFLGQFRVLVFNHFVSHDLDTFQSEKINATGKIISDPIRNGETQKISVHIDQVKKEDTDMSVSAVVLVTTDLYPVYHYGDIVSVSGVLQKPSVVKDGTGRIFNYPMFLYKDSITQTISFGSVEIIEKNKGNFFITFLYSVKEKFVQSIQNVLPEPSAGLLSGIVLGTQTLSKKVLDEFRIAGLSHVVVLSGYNITIVAESVFTIALLFAPLYASFIAVISVICFVLFSGAGASSVRAGIMTIVALLGKRFGKTYDVGRALFFAGFLMILWNPFTLLYDSSFHLSFLATYAVVYISPLFLKKLNFITERFGLRDILATTLSVNIFVLPYILYMAGTVQVYSVISNMLVLPFVPLTMLLGFFTAVFGFVSRYVGLIFGMPVYLLLLYDMGVAHSISSLPFSQISIPYVSLPVLVCVYGIFFYVWYKKSSVTNSIIIQSSSQSLNQGLSSETPEIISSDGYTVISE